MDKLERARLMINDIDKEMAELFEKRMRAVADVAQYKKEHGLPVYAPDREREVIEKNTAYIEDERIKALYREFIINTMDLAKRYQRGLMDETDRG